MSSMMIVRRLNGAIVSTTVYPTSGWKSVRAFQANRLWHFRHHYRERVEECPGGVVVTCRFGMEDSQTVTLVRHAEVTLKENRNVQIIQSMGQR